MPNTAAPLGPITMSGDDLGKLVEALARRAPDPWWKSLLQQWSGPAAVALIAGGIGAGIWFAYDTSAQLRRLPDLVDNVANLAASAADSAKRLDATEKDIGARRSAIDTWRTGIEEKVRPLEQLGYRLGSSEKRADELEKRIDRISELWQKSDNRLSAIERDAAVTANILRRMEAKGQAQPPFLESPTWNGLPDPFILRAVLRHGYLPDWSGRGSAPF